MRKSDKFRRHYIVNLVLALYGAALVITIPVIITVLCEYYLVFYCDKTDDTHFIYTTIILSTT